MCIYVYYITWLHFSLPRGRLAMEPTALPLTTGVYQQIPLASIPTDEASQARVKIRPGVVRALRPGDDPTTQRRRPALSRRRAVRGWTTLLAGRRLSPDP